MDHGYKHFSHLHNLIMHQMPEGTEVSCSGCRSSATGTVYVCWQCNFFLHEQCYRATRSLKHPSHPPHLLTLVPYPTYPSNSFYCNSCRNMGTGFSYSCADCDFDLHVQCAYSISGATSWNGIQNSIPFPPSHSTSHVQHHHSTPNDQAYVSIPPGHQNSVPFPPSHSISHVQHHSTPHDQAYVSIPPGHQNSVPFPPSHSISHVNHHSTPHDQPYVSIPPGHQNSIPFSPLESNSHVKYHSTPHDHQPYVSIPPGRHNSIPTTQNPPMAHTAHIHFSHPHNLTKVDLKPDKQNEVACSGCKDPLNGKIYSCFEPNCNFHLHESCFNLKKQIQHKSHPAHPLNLLPITPYKNTNNEFTCDACFGSGTGFTYHCSICKFDLHIQCVSLPEMVKRPDHEHTLELFYSCPIQGEECTVTCDVCHGEIQKDRWAYYCISCRDFDTHLGCVDSEKHEKDREKHERDSVVDPQVQLQRMQLELQMTQQLAQMMASMGASISNLAG